MQRTKGGEMAAAQGEAAATLTRLALQRGLDLAGASKLAERVAKLLDRALPLAAEGGKPLDCRPGCSACCRIIPFAAPPEIVRILQEIMAWPSERRQSLLNRLNAYEAEVAADRPDRFLTTRAVCPLLEGDLCSVYEVRPLMCRGLASEDVRLCQAAAERASGEDDFGPNGEYELAAAVLGGVASAFPNGGRTGARLELPLTLLRLIRGEVTAQDVIERPSTLSLSIARPWEVSLPIPPGDQLEAVRRSQDAERFIAEVRNRPPSEILHLIREPTIENRLAALRTLLVFSSPDEVIEAWLRFESGVDALTACHDFDPVSAYVALQKFQPAAAGYLQRSMRPPLGRIGAWLNDEVARRLAPDLLAPPGMRRPGKLRIGFAGSMNSSSASRWLGGFLSRLDRVDFEIFAFKVSGSRDVFTARLRHLADRYFQLSGHPLEVARFIRSHNLDYLIYSDIGDTPGHHQLAIFRLARRQAAAWGCPFTSGLPTIDDYLSIDAAEPESADGEYTENLIRLPGAGLCFERPSPSPVDWDRDRLGLPPGFLAAYPQSVFKWLPQADELLGEIAARTGNPVVMFEAGNAYEIEVTKRRLAEKRVPIHWLGLQNERAFRRVIQLFDVVLDSPSWSGGITALICLAQGVPIASRNGPWLRSRLAAGFCRVAGVGGLSTDSDSDYVDLATGADRLRDLRAQMKAEDLFGDDRPVRALEAHVKSKAQSP